MLASLTAVPSPALTWLKRTALTIPVTMLSRNAMPASRALARRVMCVVLLLDRARRRAGGWTLPGFGRQGRRRGGGWRRGRDGRSDGCPPRLAAIPPAPQPASREL